MFHWQGYYIIYMLLPYLVNSFIHRKKSKSLDKRYVWNGRRALLAETMCMWLKTFLSTIIQTISNPFLNTRVERRYCAYFMNQTRIHTWQSRCTFHTNFQHWRAENLRTCFIGNDIILFICCSRILLTVWFTDCCRWLFNEEWKSWVYEQSTILCTRLIN